MPNSTRITMTGTPCKIGRSDICASKIMAQKSGAVRKRPLIKSPPMRTT